MRGFFDLVGFEYKKMLHKKATIITLILVTIFILVSPAMILMGDIYVDGEPVETKYEAMQKDRVYARALSGRAIDEILFAEAMDAYAKVPLVERYATTPEYEQYGRPYSEIFRILRSMHSELDMESLRGLTAEEIGNFYQLRHKRVAEEVEALDISDGAKETLIRLDSEQETPWTFYYTDGYQRFLIIMYTSGMLIAFAAAVCLAPMFAGEYGTGTSQLILSSKFGKSKVISAKIFTALSFSAVLCLLLTAATYFVCMAVFGPDGADAQLSLYWRSFLIFPMTTLKATVLFSVCILCATIYFSAITLLLSSKLKSSFGVIIIAGLLIVAPMMITVSEQNILLFNLVRLFPSNMMVLWGPLSCIPYEIFGLSIWPYIFLPVFAVTASAAMLPFARRAFRNHQIG